MGELIVARYDDPNLPNILRRPYNLWEYVEKVRPIVEDVAKRGLEALKEYTVRFDGAEPKRVIIDATEAWELIKNVDPKVLEALRTAIDNVRAFHERILSEYSMSYERGGLRFRVKMQPVPSVGVYVPGGAHPYPSSAVMGVVPAKVAGVERVVVASPPCREEPNRGLPNPIVVAASVLSGADEILVAGGAQAIAALAYGLSNILEPVSKIVGPGSPYVEAAKLIVSHRVGIDMVAGPSEVAVIADGRADARAIALEMLSQLEHGPLSTALLVTNSPWLLESVKTFLERYVHAENMGRAILVYSDTLDRAVKIINEFAPEHLYIDVERPEKIVEKVRNAGLVSMGVPTALTDYVAGPNHILPTGGFAKVRGGLSPVDFVKTLIVVEGKVVHPKMFEAALTLAEAEGFRWHAEALRYWLQKLA